MHTIREHKEVTGYGYKGAEYSPTGKWEVGSRQSGFGGTIWHVAAVCDTRDEAIEICCKLNGGK